MQQKAVGAECATLKPLTLNGLSGHKSGGGGGNRTPVHTPSSKNTTETEEEQSQANPQHNNELQDSDPFLKKHKSAQSEQDKDKTLHQKCALCVQQNQSISSDDLNKVVDAWDDLPEVVKAGILAMVDISKVDRER